MLITVLPSCCGHACGKRSSLPSLGNTLAIISQSSRKPLLGSAARVLCCAKSVSRGDDNALEYYDNMFEQLMALLLFNECNFADKNSVTDNRVVASSLSSFFTISQVKNE